MLFGHLCNQSDDRNPADLENASCSSRPLLYCVDFTEKHCVWIHGTRSKELKSVNNS